MLDIMIYVEDPDSNFKMVQRAKDWDLAEELVGKGRRAHERAVKTQVEIQNA